MLKNIELLSPIALNVRNGSTIDHAIKAAVIEEGDGWFSLSFFWLDEDGVVQFRGAEDAPEIAFAGRHLRNAPPSIRKEAAMRAANPPMTREQALAILRQYSGGESWGCQDKQLIEATRVMGGSCWVSGLFFMKSAGGGLVRISKPENAPIFAFTGRHARFAPPQKER